MELGEAHPAGLGVAAAQAPLGGGEGLDGLAQLDGDLGARVTDMVAILGRRLGHDTGRKRVLALGALGAREHEGGDRGDGGEQQDPDVGVAERVAAAAGVCAPVVRPCWSTTVSSAVPIEPPTRWSTLSCGVAWAMSSGRRRA